VLAAFQGENMMRSVIRLMLIVTVVAVAAPREARADGFVNPWAGVNFGSEIEDGRGGFGINAGGMGGGIIGGEVAFGYSPSFFGTKNDFGNNTVVDLMGNVILGIPFGGQTGGGFRPYVTAGMGLIRTQIDGGTVFDVSSSSNNLGFNLGGGFMGYFNDHVGLRGDLRYLRTMTGDVVNEDLDLGGFHFWRLSAGLVLR
jgi:opacity protein-like surface antigen